MIQFHLQLEDICVSLCQHGATRGRFESFAACVRSFWLIFVTQTGRERDQQTERKRETWTNAVLVCRETRAIFLRTDGDELFDTISQISFGSFD